MEKEIVLFEDNGIKLEVPITPEEETVWLNRAQMAELFDRDIKTIGKHIAKSRRGVAFRKWANSVLKQYIIKGYAVNNNRINQLGEVIRIMKRTENELDSRQVLSVIEKYSKALELLDAYDHQSMVRPSGSQANYIFTYEECKNVIASMKFGNESELFGKEKAAHLLYFVTKNHSFLDGNKRIAATMFLHF